MADDIRCPETGRVLTFGKVIPNMAAVGRGLANQRTLLALHEPGLPDSPIQMNR